MRRDDTNRRRKTYIGDDVDKSMCDCVRKDPGIGFIKTSCDRLNAVAIAVEANVAKQVYWNLRVLQHTGIDGRTLKLMT